MNCLSGSIPLLYNIGEQKHLGRVGIEPGTSCSITSSYFKIKGVSFQEGRLCQLPGFQVAALWGQAEEDLAMSKYGYTGGVRRPVDNSMKGDPEGPSIEELQRYFKVKRQRASIRSTKPWPRGRGVECSSMRGFFPTFELRSIATSPSLIFLERLDAVILSEKQALSAKKIQGWRNYILWFRFFSEYCPLVIPQWARLH